MNAELHNLSVDDATQTEEIIVSQWRYISADEKHQMRQQVDQILRPLGLETRLLVVNQISSLAVFFNCTSQRAVRSLRVHWNSGQLSDIIEALFTLLSGVTVRIRKLTCRQLARLQRVLLQFLHSIPRLLHVRRQLPHLPLWTHCLSQL